MPLTEKLEKALNDTSVATTQVADLLKKDGLNCRESNSFDTPLIIAIRANNLPVVNLILSLVKTPVEKNDVLNAKNKQEETPLKIALLTNNKKIALQLIKQGADISKSSINLPANALEWLRVFTDYQKLKSATSLDAETLKKKASLEAEIGSRYAREAEDLEEAKKWYEIAAKDGDKQAMINLAMNFQEDNHFLEAVQWYKKSYPLWTEPKNQDAIIQQLTSIADAFEKDEGTFLANMTLGGIYAERGNINSAFTYFNRAEEIAQNLSPDEKTITLFKACSLWHGPSVERETTAEDYIDVTKRFELLLQSQLPEGKSLIIAIAKSGTPIILKIAASEICKQQKLIKDVVTQTLSQPENKSYIQALSTLYGWNNQPKNTLRSAGLFRKLADNENDVDNKVLCHILIAFSYFQQEQEKDVYTSEAFLAFDNAHAALGKMKTPKRLEVAVAFIDAGSFVTEASLNSYILTLLNCYERDAEVAEIETMDLLAQHLTRNISIILPEMPFIAEKLSAIYQKQKDANMHQKIYELLKELHKDTPDESKMVLEKALAECAQSSVDTKKYSSEHLNDLVQSYEKLAENVEGQETGDFQEKYTDALMLRGETHLNQHKYEAALEDFSQVYKATESLDALIKMAMIETELGLYDEAIEHYRFLSESQMHESSVFLSALRNLCRIFDELIPRDSRREKISNIAKPLLQTILKSDTGNINTFEKLEELKTFCDIAGEDQEIQDLFKVIHDKIAPLEQERLDKEKKLAEREQFLKRQTEPRGRSPDLHLSTLLSLAQTEKEDPLAVKIINEAIQSWIDGAVKIQDDNITVRNEKGLVQLTKFGNIPANYYLAKFYEQQNNMQVALSLYARLIMLPGKDEKIDKLKRESKHFIHAVATQEGGLTKIFSKQQQFRQYATDLLDVFKKHPEPDSNPDAVIQTMLQEKTSNLESASSYNNYLLAIGQILGYSKERHQRGREEKK